MCSFVDCNKIKTSFTFHQTKFSILRKLRKCYFLFWFSSLAMKTIAIIFSSAGYLKLNDLYVVFGAQLYQWDINTNGIENMIFIITLCFWRLNNIRSMPISRSSCAQLLFNKEMP